MKSFVPWTLAGVVLILISFWIIRYFLEDVSQPRGDGGAVNIKVQLEGVRDHADLLPNPDGTYSYGLLHHDGTRETLTPQQFADRIYRQQTSRGILAKIFNISSRTGIIWVSLGLLGQLMFTGRMLVQWLVSERKRRSVVPTIFWWLSVLGGAMLLAYFLWRRDIVGVLGQAFGLAIYLRNIHLIYRVKRAALIVEEPIADDLGPSR